MTEPTTQESGSKSAASSQRHVRADLEERAFRGHEMGRKRAVDGGADGAVVGALVVQPAPAIGALAAGQPRRNHDAVARRKRRHAVADGRHHADAFMADDDAGRRLVGRRHGQNVEIGAADAARFNIDENIIRPGDLRNRSIFVDQLPVTVKNRNCHCGHGESLSGKLVC